MVLVAERRPTATRPPSQVAKVPRLLERQVEAAVPRPAAGRPPPPVRVTVFRTLLARRHVGRQAPTPVAGQLVPSPETLGRPGRRRLVVRTPLGPMATRDTRVDRRPRR